MSVLVAVLGLGFGLLQMINRPDASQAMLAVAQADPVAAAVAPVDSSASSAQTVQVAAVTGGPQPLAVPAAETPRRVQASVHVLQPNYTVAAGDTLGRIAARFNTTVERIQALNNLANPRALRIGTKLVIPPPL